MKKLHLLQAAALGLMLGGTTAYAEDITFAVADFAVEADSVDPGPGDNRTGLTSRFGVRRSATPGGGFHCAAAGPGAAAAAGPVAPGAAAALLLLTGLRGLLRGLRPRRRR